MAFDAQVHGDTGGSRTPLDALDPAETVPMGDQQPQVMSLQGHPAIPVEIQNLAGSGVGKDGIPAAELDGSVAEPQGPRGSYRDVQVIQDRAQDRGVGAFRPEGVLRFTRDTVEHEIAEDEYAASGLDIGPQRVPGG